MAKKNKLIRSAVFFLATALALLTFSKLVDFGVRHSDREGFKKVNIILTQKIDPDIMVFGSSVGEKGFNSNIVIAATGLDAYNASIDGTNFEQYRCLVEEYNKYSKKRSCVLFFESYFSMQKNNGISSIERYSAYLDNDAVYNSLYSIDSDITWKVRYIPLYKSTVVDHTYYNAAFSGWRNYFARKGLTDSLRGFVPSYLDWEKDADSVLSRTRFRIVVDRSIVKDYIQMIENMQRNGKKVMIIMPPVYERVYQKSVDFAPLERTLDSIAATANCQFLNFTKLPSISPHKEYFFNGNHMNFKGSVVFSDTLAALLRKTLR